MTEDTKATRMNLEETAIVRISSKGYIAWSLYNGVDHLDESVQDLVKTARKKLKDGELVHVVAVSYLNWKGYPKKLEGQKNEKGEQAYEYPEECTLEGEGFKFPYQICLNGKVAASPFPNKERSGYPRTFADLVPHHHQPGDEVYLNVRLELRPVEPKPEEPTEKPETLAEMLLGEDVQSLNKTLVWENHTQ